MSFLAELQPINPKAGVEVEVEMRLRLKLKLR
jgi:hypothetical protein